MDDVRAVLDAAGSQRAAVLGYSEGGPLSILLAAAYPERVSELILFATFPCLHAAPDFPEGAAGETAFDRVETVLNTWGQGELRNGDELAGIAVHTGARVMAAANAGEVLVSRVVRDLVAGSGLAFFDRGSHTLKDIPGQWELYSAGAS